MGRTIGRETIGPGPQSGPRRNPISTVDQYDAGDSVALHSYVAWLKLGPAMWFSVWQFDTSHFVPAIADGALSHLSCMQHRLSLGHPGRKGCISDTGQTHLSKFIYKSCFPPAFDTFLHP